MTDRKISCVRVYDWSPTSSSAAFLVDRLWPRGLRKSDLPGVQWVKEAAPSAELRKWFGHRPDRWEEFRTRYLRELDEHRDDARPLLDAARNGDVTLLYASRDDEHNNAVVLRQWLLTHR